MRAVIYARYSSDKQSDRSIEDQVRLCQERIAADGHELTQVYSDHAISGATLLRPGIQAVMADATRAKFDLVYAEALDRISRDQEGVAGFFKRMKHADVHIITLGEGEISELHVGLKGTMNALFLADLANKTRRGLRGRIEAGRSGGGLTYGYDVVRRVRSDGTLDVGERRISEAEAKVVKRIFEE
jgi:site-specific DNA recombinase